MKNISFICALFVSTVLFSQEPLVQNIGDFTTLKVYNGITVELIKSTDQKIEITGEKAEIVKVKNVNKTANVFANGNEMQIKI